MAELVACPECKKHLQVPDDLLGKNVQCPECKHTFIATLPEPEEPRTKTATKTSSPPTKKAAWEKSSKVGSTSSGRKKKRRDDEDDDDYDPRDRDDDDDDDRSRSRSRRRRSSSRRYDGVAHRGTLVLVFGIIGLLSGIPVFSIIAWVMGNSDLREMQEGRMDPEGEGMTQVGRILGIVGAILWIIFYLSLFGFFCVFPAIAFLFLLVVGGAAANANRNFPPPPQRRF